MEAFFVQLPTGNILGCRLDGRLKVSFAVVVLLFIVNWERTNREANSAKWTVIGIRSIYSWHYQMLPTCLEGI
jgi:hypothetical protein